MCMKFIFKRLFNYIEKNNPFIGSKYNPTIFFLKKEQIALFISKNKDDIEIIDILSKGDTIYPISYSEDSYVPDEFKPFLNTCEIFCKTIIKSKTYQPMIINITKKIKIRVERNKSDPSIIEDFMTKVYIV